MIIVLAVPRSIAMDWENNFIVGLRNKRINV
jgi:hypothetical protein